MWQRVQSSIWSNLHNGSTGSVWQMSIFAFLQQLEISFEKRSVECILYILFYLHMTYKASRNVIEWENWSGQTMEAVWCLAQGYYSWCWVWKWVGVWKLDINRCYLELEVSKFSEYVLTVPFSIAVKNNFRKLAEFWWNYRNGGWNFYCLWGNTVRNISRDNNLWFFIYP